MGISLQTVEFYDNGGGVDLKSSPTKVVADEASSTLNIDYSTDGAFLTRYGSSIQNVSAGIPAQMSGAPKTLAIFDYKKEDGTEIEIVCAGTTIKHGLTNPTNQVTGLDATEPIPDIEFMVTLDDEYAFWGNGIDENLKFNGSSWTNWSIEQAGNPSAADNGAGLLGAGDYYYYVSFARVVSGVIVQEGELNATVATVTIGANRQIQVTLPTSSDSQVNARVIYRRSPTSAGVYYRLAIVNDNVTLTYNDNTVDDGTIEAQFDNQAAPTTAVFEEYLGRMYIVSADRQTDVYFSKVNKPWNVPTGNFSIFDGPVKCIRRCFGALIFGTDKSLWVLNGDITSNAPRRISSIIGILNNRCAVGEDILYILATNRKMYGLTPTDFSQDQIRLDRPLSLKIDPVFSLISGVYADKVCMEYYTKADVSKVVISAPTALPTNDLLMIYNESQSLIKNKPVWQLWDNIAASALKQMVINSEIALYSGDYNGFLWKLDDNTMYGDGAEENGTVTAAGASTLTDTSKTWTVNEFVGVKVRIIDGMGVNQVRTITANTANTITVNAAWTTALNASSEYTIGGYDAYHYTSWLPVVESFDVLKQLWFVWFNANTTGDYNISLILQKDFDQSETNQQAVLINLQAENTIWGAFLWGQASWGARSVFQDRVRFFARFRAIRLGFKNRKAGQPFQINGFSLSVQNKKLFFSSAA